MKIPKVIRINGIDYVVKRSEVVTLGSSVCFGMVDKANCEIQLSTTVQDHQHMCMTLWHEIFHVLVDNAGLEIAEEEMLVERLARGVYQVLQDNGKRLFDIKG